MNVVVDPVTLERVLARLKHEQSRADLAIIVRLVQRGDRQGLNRTLARMRRTRPAYERMTALACRRFRVRTFEQALKRAE